MLSLACSFYSLQIFSQEKVIYYYPDSTISSTGNILDGRPDGYWKNYFIDDVLKSEGKWYSGLLDSTWNFYFHSGYIKLKIQYNKGVRNGYTYTYKMNRDSIHYLYKQELFVDGQLEGKSFTYDYAGNVIKVTNYKRNNKTGNEIELSHSGVPKKVYSYENNRLVSAEDVNQIFNGSKNGTWIALDDNYKIISQKLLSNDSVLKDQFNTKALKVKYTIEGLEEQIKDSTYQGQFKNGIPIGRHLLYDSLLHPVSYIIYDSLGRKLEVGQIKNYKLSGPIKGYYLDGKLKYNGLYKANKKEGLWQYYYPEGVIEQKGLFKNGKVNGKWVWFYKNSDTLRIETFRFGKRDGLYLSFDPYGRIVKKGFYYNDLKQETWIENTGEFLLEGNYFDGLKNGKWIGIYHHAEKAYIGEYLRGKPQGKHVYYYRNGNKRKIEYYNIGRAVGHWQYFNQRGKLYKVKSYNKGESIFFKD